MTFTYRRPLRHQQAAVKAVASALRNGGRGQMLHACGSGKTLTCQMVSETLGSRVTLVLLPSLALVTQTMTEWTHQSRGSIRTRAVCSDASARPYNLPASGHDGRVLADPRDIAAFLSDKTDRRNAVLFSTYQSSPKIAVAQALVGEAVEFDLTVCDEAHRLAGEVNRAYSTVLNPALIRSRRILFTTATPRITHAGSTGHRTVGMDNEDVFGPVLHRYTFAQAIRDRRLTDYRVVVLGVGEHDLRRLPSISDDADENRATAAHVATLQAMKAYDLRRVVTFHATVARTEAFTDTLSHVNQSLPRAQQVSRLRHAMVHGNMPSWQRQAGMHMLAHPAPGSSVVLSNPRCLTEGVDVPALDGIVVVDPRESAVDMVQMIGRVLRNSPGKTVGTIVVPVMIKPGVTAKSALREAGFRQAWNVVAALRDHDEDMAATIDGSVRKVASGKVPAIPRRVVMSFPMNATLRLAEAAQVRLVEQTSSTPVRSPGLPCHCGCGMPDRKALTR